MMQTDSPLRKERTRYLMFIETLLEAGASLTARDRNGWTAMHFACATGDLELVQLVLKRPSGRYILVDESRRTPLHVAAESGAADIVRAMISKPETNLAHYSTQDNDHEQTIEESHPLPESLCSLHGTPNLRVNLFATAPCLVLSSHMFPINMVNGRYTSLQVAIKRKLSLHFWNHQASDWTLSIYMGRLRSTWLRQGITWDAVQRFEPRSSSEHATIWPNCRPRVRREGLCLLLLYLLMLHLLSLQWWDICSGTGTMRQ